MARGSRDLLKVLANGTNREILSLLRAEPTYPRRLAELVGITEGEAQKRLRLLEEHGVVKGAWVHVGKNVKRYTLEAKALRIEVGPDGLSLALEGGVQEPVKLAASQEAIPSAEHVIGRRAELVELAELLAGKGSAAVLGIAGTGKSSLAARFARTQERPVFWTTLRGTEGAPQLLSRLAVFLGSRGLEEVVASYVHLDAGQDFNAQVALLTEGLGRADALVVVDDVHLARDESLRGVLATLLDRAGPYRVLLVGRTLPKGLPRAKMGLLSLGGLAPADTMAFLDAKGLRHDDGGAEAIQAKTAGHPLALTLLAEAARGRELGLRELAALLPATRIEAYLWEEVFSDLTPEERTFLSRIAVLRGALDADLAEAVAEDGRARERLWALEKRNLVVPVGEGYTIHDVVRQFAAKLGKASPEAHRRAGRALEARGGLADAIEALHHHLAAGDTAAGVALVRREQEDEAYRFVDQGLGVAYGALLAELAPRLEGMDQALVRLEAAKCRVRTADPKEVMGEVAALAKVLGPKAPLWLRLQLLALQGELAYRQGDYAGSVQRWTRLLLLADPAEHGRLVDDALHERANALEDGGRIVEAHQGYKKALDRARRAGDLRRAALIRGSLARTALYVGKPRESLQHIEAGLEAAKELRHLRVEANLRRALSEYWLSQRDPAKAYDAALQYLDVARRLGDPWGVCCALMDMSWILVRQDRWGDVAHYLDGVEDTHACVPMPFFLAQAKAMRVAVAAAQRDWPVFEQRAATVGAEDPAANWFYASRLFLELGDRLQGLLTPEAKPSVGRLLQRRRDLAPWLREALEGYAAGKPPGPPRSLHPHPPDPAVAAGAQARRRVRPAAARRSRA